MPAPLLLLTQHTVIFLNQFTVTPSLIIAVKSVTIRFIINASTKTSKKCPIPSTSASGHKQQ